MAGSIDSLKFSTVFSASVSRLSTKSSCKQTDMGIPGDIGVPATENLRLYLSQAILPLMKLSRNAPQLPPSGHRSHNIGLTTRPERYRRLEFMFQDLGIDVEVDVPNCMRSWPPYLWRASSPNGIILDISQVVVEHPLKEGDCDPETGTAIRIPCNPAFDIPQPNIPPPTDLDWCDTSLAAHSNDMTK